MRYGRQIFEPDLSIRSAIATIENAIRGRERMTVRTQQTKVVRSVIPPVAVDVINFDGNSVGDGVSLGPAAFPAGFPALFSQPPANGGGEIHTMRAGYFASEPAPGVLALTGLTLAAQVAVDLGRGDDASAEATHPRLSQYSGPDASGEPIGPLVNVPLLL